MPPTHYDVFISRKSQDAHLAKELYEYLTAQGLTVFESDNTLKQLGNADYIKAIDEALISSTHMVVVGSSTANIQSSWVEAEWLFFLNRKRSGKTSGNLLTVATNTLKLEDVPPSLANYEIIPYSEKNFPNIYNYVRQPNTPPKQALKSPHPQNSDANKAQEYFEKGDKLYDEGKYEESFIYLLKAADLRHAEACFRVGAYYNQGIGVKIDYSQSLKWYNEAIKYGCEYAYINLGLLYQEGKGVQKDYSKALQLYLKFSNESASQNNIGGLYLHGLGVKQDYKQAMEWFLKAAQNGNASAQNNIGKMYLDELGVKQDFEQAMFWFLKSAEQNNDTAQLNIGYMYQEGQGVKQDYLQALSWYEKAAQKENTLAQIAIGYLHQTGLGVRQDYSKSFYWYSKAAEKGDSGAQVLLGIFLFYGTGIKQDKKLSKYWLEKAKSQGDENAKDFLDENFNQKSIWDILFR